MSLHPQVLWSTGTGLCPQPGTSARPTSTTAGSLIARRPPLLTSGRSPPSPSQVRSQCSCRAGTPAALLLLLLAEERLCPAQHQHFKFLPNPPSPRQGVLSCPDHSRSVLVFVPPGLPESVSFRFTGTSATFFFLATAVFILLLPFPLPVSPWPLFCCRHTCGHSVGISGNARAWGILICQVPSSALQKLSCSLLETSFSSGCLESVLKARLSPQCEQGVLRSHFL